MEGDSSGAHEWLIEFENEPQDLEKFKRIFDMELKELNSDYDAKRTNDYTLKEPIIRSLPKGVFHHWLKERGKLGGQHKVPRLSNNRSFIEELNSIITEV